MTWRRSGAERGGGGGGETEIDSQVQQPLHHGDQVPGPDTECLVTMVQANAW